MVMSAQIIFKNTTFCLCYAISLQFCYLEIFSLAGKTIDISYLLARNLEQDYVVLLPLGSIKQK